MKQKNLKRNRKKTTESKPDENEKMKQKNQKRNRKRTTESKPKKTTKKKITSEQVCRFLGLREYPVPSGAKFDKYEDFSKYYFPLVAIFNRGAHPLLHTLVQANSMKFQINRP